MFKLLLGLMLVALSACQSTAASSQEVAPALVTTASSIVPSPTEPSAATLPAATSPTQSTAEVPAANPPPPVPAPTPTPTPRPQGGSAMLGLLGQPDGLNPITENNPALREITPLLFATLLQVDPQTGQLQPGLAQRWEYRNNGQQVIFHLPAQLKWSDGSPLSAAAIVASLKATEHPALTAFSRLEALNPTTLQLTFAGIDCSAVTALAQLPLLPAAQILETTPAGSGPFRVATWSVNKRVLTLTRNPHYYGPQPALDGLTLRFLAPDDAAIALSEGQFDLVGPLQAPVANYQLPDYTHLTYPAPQLVYLAINYASKNSDPLPAEVREALLLALDRETLLAETLKGDGQLLAGSLLPGHWAANPNLTWPDYNPAEARRWLAKAGLKDEDGDGWLDQNGRRLELSIRLNSDNALHQNLGWLISSYYREVGLFARAEGVSFDNILDDLFTHDFTLAISSWPLLPDPDQRLFWRSTENSEGFGLNFTSFNSPELDKLMDRAVAMPGCDSQSRARIYADIQAILAQERPVDFLVGSQRRLLVAKRLQGLTAGPFAPFTWNAVHWYVQEN